MFPFSRDERGFYSVWIARLESIRRRNPIMMVYFKERPVAPTIPLIPPLRHSI